MGYQKEPAIIFQYTAKLSHRQYAEQWVTESVGSHKNSERDLELEIFVSEFMQDLTPSPCNRVSKEYRTLDVRCTGQNGGLGPSAAAPNPSIGAERV